MDVILVVMRFRHYFFS